MARSFAEGALPPPVASFEIWDFPIGDPSLADHEGMYMLGVGQEFPAAGSRDARALREVEAARAWVGELREAARDVWGQVAIACVQWSAAQEVKNRLESHRALVLEMRDATLAGYRAGGDGLGMVARAEAELATAERHIAEAEEEVRALHDSLGAQVGDSVRLPDAAPPLRDRALSPNLERLTESALASRGDIRAAQARRSSAQASVDAAEADASSPSFEVRATYMQTPSERAGLGAMVAMSLPWLWGGGPELHESAKHELEAAQAEQADVDRKVRVEVTRAAARVRAQARALAILRQREIPASKGALEAERAAQRAGDFNLVSWIQSAHALREAHIDEARVRGALELAFIELELAVGHPLEGTDSGEQP